MQTAEQLARKLTDSGVISVAELDRFRDTLPPSQRSDSAEDLSRSLVANRLVTEYQLDAIQSDAPHPLVVGDYVVLEKIGAGGMGVVFKAEHRRMKRKVALKMLPPEICDDETSLRRFEREVEVAAKLNHKNIVAALDAREDQGHHYLIMEYVAGRSLQSIVHDQGVLPLPIAVDYIIQAAHGLGHAHRQGVIHRDIKPSNMMVDGEGVVKILDMGLARAELPAAGRIRPDADRLDQRRSGDGHAGLRLHRTGGRFAQGRSSHRCLQPGLHAVLLAGRGSPSTKGRHRWRS